MAVVWEKLPEMKPRTDERAKQLAQASSKVVLRSHVNPVDDMAAERARASFDSQQLAEYFNEGPDKLKRRGELIKFLQSQPWADKSRRYHWTRREEYVSGLRGILSVWDLMNSGKMSRADAGELRKLLAYPTGMELHIGMFIPALMSQGSEEQQAYWLPKAMSLEIIGTYAQTELGHGTFVRGLETTATYDEQSQEFVIHSPELTSTKWWPGGLGKTADHVILMARLFLKGKDHGPHAFVMRIRDAEKHHALPGITVGDIGPKFGYNSVDNGYLRFDHVRLPRDAMLMRFAKVTPEGKYVPPPPSNAKASYATLVFVRATIVEEAGWYLAKSATIAIRYTAVRRQTSSKPGERETQVLDYQNTSAELLPLLACSYALVFMGKAGWDMYRLFEKQREKGDFSILPELHSTLSGMKALGTTLASNGMEACRRCCGGHGYSLQSGLPTLFSSYVQNATWEGDNNVLYLQQGRALIKGLAGASEGKAPEGAASYLAHVEREQGATSSTTCEECWRDAGHVTTALRHRAARLCVEATKQLLKAGAGQLRFEGPPWNNNTVHVIRTARAHSTYVLHKTFSESLDKLQAEHTLKPPALAALRKLLALFGVTMLASDLGDFLEDGFLSGKQAAALRTLQYQLLLELRPDAVALVDSFGFDDYQLNSAIGRYDGDVYTALLKDAELSTLNDTQEGPAWESVLKPVINAHRPASKL